MAVCTLLSFLQYMLGPAASRRTEAAWMSPRTRWDMSLQPQGSWNWACLHISQGPLGQVPVASWKLGLGLLGRPQEHSSTMQYCLLDAAAFKPAPEQVESTAPQGSYLNLQAGESRLHEPSAWRKLDCQSELRQLAWNGTLAHFSLV